MVDIENTPWVHVGIAECPICKVTCVGHIVLKRKTIQELAGWKATALDYYCFSCKASFQKPGSQAFWLHKQYIPRRTE